MAGNEDIRFTLGEISGKLDGLLKVAEENRERMNNHGERIRHLEIRTTVIWLVGVVVAGVATFALNFKKIFT